MKKIEEIFAYHRQEGHTDWILKSAIDNPNVMIVARDSRSLRDLQRRYREFLSEHEKNISTFERLVKVVINRKTLPKPTFVTMDNVIVQSRGIRKPIIFDNACFYER